MNKNIKIIVPLIFAVILLIHSRVIYQKIFVKNEKSTYKDRNAESSEKLKLSVDSFALEVQKSIESREKTDEKINKFYEKSSKEINIVRYISNDSLCILYSEWLSEIKNRR